MKVFQRIGIFAIGAALCVASGWCGPLQNSSATPLTQPTAKQMQALKKILAGQAPQTNAASNAETLLPAKFGGWMRGSTGTAQPEAANAAALNEFGLTGIEQAEYTRTGDSVSVRVLKFQNATGAYGAFTMLRNPEMEPARIGSGRSTFFNGAIAGRQVLFWKGDLLVDARFAHPVTDARLAATNLGEMLPQTTGLQSVAPVLQEQLPRKGLNAGSVQYSLGPASYQREGGELPPSVVDFQSDAEVVMARYGNGMLTIISYPTPEIAQVREAAIASVLKSGIVPGPKDAQLVKRAGPLVAMTSGNFTAAEATALLKQVQFRGTVAIDQLKPQESQAVQTAKMLLGIAALTAILGSAAIILGFLFGGGRAIYRVMRGRPASSMYDIEFIALDLNKQPVASSEPPRNKSADG